MTTIHPILKKIRAEDPGKPPSAEELERIEKDQPELAPRIRATREAVAREQIILKETVEKVLKKYDFKGRFDYGSEKCYRDVGSVYRYCIFSMLCEDEDMLRNKLLFWMRTIIQSLDFPSGNESIRFCYSLLRETSRRNLSPDSSALMDPYLKIVEEILPS